jgi:hypothetical protein
MPGCLTGLPLLPLSTSYSHPLAQGGAGHYCIWTLPDHTVQSTFTATAKIFCVASDIIG